MNAVDRALMTATLLAVILASSVTLAGLLVLGWEAAECDTLGRQYSLVRGCLR